MDTTPRIYTVREAKRNNEKLQRNSFCGSKGSSKKLAKTNGIVLDSRVGRKLANTVTNRFSIYDVENIAGNSVLAKKIQDTEKSIHVKREKPAREQKVLLYFYKNRYKYPPRSPRTHHKNRKKHVRSFSDNSDRNLKRRFSLRLKMDGKKREHNLMQRNKRRDQTLDKDYCSAEADFYAAQVRLPFSCD